MTHKERALEAIAHLPADCTFDDMAEKIRFLAGVQAGLDELDRGEKIDHEAIKKKVASWASV